MFNEYDIVELQHDRPIDKLCAGAIGTVLMVYRQPVVGYEVEFLDNDGKTIALLTLLETEVVEPKYLSPRPQTGSP
jgi:hypothetical protein